MNAARPAEPVRNDPIIEDVGADRVVRSKEPHVAMRHRPQQRAFTRTDGTIAGDRGVEPALDLEGDLAAVTASAIEHDQTSRLCEAFGIGNCRAECATLSQI